MINCSNSTQTDLDDYIGSVVYAINILHEHAQCSALLVIKISNVQRLGILGSHDVSIVEKYRSSKQVCQSFKTTILASTRESALADMGKIYFQTLKSLAIMQFNRKHCVRSCNFCSHVVGGFSDDT